MRILTFITLLTLLGLPSLANAAKALEGEEAEKLYQADKGKAQTLVQHNKEFILRAPDGTETRKPETITLKVNERFYITNEEENFVHNVYDSSDSSWVLKKQQPTGVAAITFEKPGTHQLRCAIHPTMKITANVIE